MREGREGILKRALVEAKGESVYVGSEACFLAVSSISSSTNWLFNEMIKSIGIKGNFC